MKKKIKYIFALLLSLLCFLLLFFKISVIEDIELYKISSAARYMVPFDNHVPSKNTIHDFFTTSVDAFKRKKVVLLIGNSTMAGMGANDSSFFTRYLTKDHDVINAAVGGELINASIGLSIIALEQLRSRNHAEFIDVYIGYMPTRLYVYDGYWKMEEAIKTSIAERGLSKYFSVEKFNRNKFKETEINIQNFFRLHQKCIADRNILIAPFKVVCARPIPSAVLPQANTPEKKLTIKSKTEADDSAQFIRNHAAYLFNKIVETNVNALTLSVKSLEEYLKDSNLKYRLHFIFFSEAPQVILCLNPDEVISYQTGRQEFLKALKARQPDWDT